MTFDISVKFLPLNHISKLYNEMFWKNIFESFKTKVLFLQNNRNWFQSFWIHISKIMSLGKKLKRKKETEKEKKEPS